MDLPFDTNSFDVVHAHQVLQHVPDPIAALVEMRRVCRPGGIVSRTQLGLRGVHLGAGGSPDGPVVGPTGPWPERDGGELDAGRRLLGWVHAAGFTPGGAERLGVVLRHTDRASGGAACGPTA